MQRLTARRLALKRVLKRVNAPLVSLVFLAALASAASAQGGLVSDTFTGTVTFQQNTAYAVGQTVTGTLTYDPVARDYAAFTLGGYRVLGGAPTAFVGPTFALFRDQYSTITGAPLNETVAVGLDGTFVPVGTAAFLAHPPAFTGGTLTYYRGTASGTNITQLQADLTRFAAAPAAVVPEPTTVALVGAGLVGLGFARRRA